MSRVLLLEPDRMLAETYSRALNGAGHHVTVCATAQGAIMAADEQQPDIVVLELQLVAHSGIEFLYEFRSYIDWTNIPVIIHTHVPAGEFGGSREVLMGELNVCTYLYKPTTPLQKVLAAVNEFAIAGQAEITA